jgi:hypothetical protein
MPKSYFETHSIYNRNAYENHLKDRQIRFLKHKTNYWEKYLKYFNENANILEIWSWVWDFAYFCSQMWVKNYIGIDIDDYFFLRNKADFPKYKFIKTKFQDFLDKENNETIWYDVIYTAHVFEHLDEKERMEMIKIVYANLKKWWIWINYMPNADSTMFIARTRYWDITHKTIYNANSFTQLLNIAEIDYEIEHFNSIPLTFLRRFIHRIFTFFTNIYFLWMTGEPMPKIYTLEMFTILTKK